MSIFDLFRRKPTKQSSSENNTHNIVQPLNEKPSTFKPVANKVPESPNNMFSREELKSIIETIAKVSYIFRDSQLLASTGGNRNISMMSKTHSYLGMLGYLYEIEYKYGKISDFCDSQISNHCQLVFAVMSDVNHRKKSFKEMADNWSDVLQVIFNMQLEDNPDGRKLNAIKTDLDKVNEAIERISGSRCREPKNPMKATVTMKRYNPFKITEDPNMAQGHCIPDIKEVFLQDLKPQLAYAKTSGQQPKDVVAKYTVDMIKSYYDNAGFVPMVIVDMITGQISQVIDMIQPISFAPAKNLKEYVLNQIYRN